MMQKILVTLDGSRLSEAVIDPVVRLVSGTQVQVILLIVGAHSSDVPTEIQGPEPPAALPLGVSVYSGPPPEPIEVRPYETVDQLYARRRDELEGYLAPHLERLRKSGINAGSEVKIGDPVESIIDYARTAKVDLIAMATHGRTGLVHLLLGSVAEQVVGSGVAPVLLVHPEINEPTN